MYQQLNTDEIEASDSAADEPSTSEAAPARGASPRSSPRQVPDPTPFAAAAADAASFHYSPEEEFISNIDTLSFPESYDSLQLDSQFSLPTSLPDRLYPESPTATPAATMSLSFSPATAPPHFSMKASHPDAISIGRRNSLDAGPIRRVGGPAAALRGQGPVRRTAIQQFKPSISPGQPVPGRAKDKWVSLSTAILEGEVGEEEEAAIADKVVKEFDELLPEDHEGTRISAFCIADSLDRTALREHADVMAPLLTMVHFYDDVIHAQYVIHPEAEERPGDIFFFDYGCVAFCGLTPVQEQLVLKEIASECAVGLLSESLAETDTLSIIYNSAVDRPRVANDRISLPRAGPAPGAGSNGTSAEGGSGSGAGEGGLLPDHRWPLSVAHAMAQSVKLYTVEARVLSLVAATKHLPEVLASTGQVLVGPGEVTQLLGRVLMHKADINLLLPVLDTPEFFWSAPDAMQHLYEKVCDYLELSDRVQVLNTRVNIVEEMLDMLRAQQNYSLHSRLEWIIIFLIVADTLPAVLKAFFL